MSPKPAPPGMTFVAQIRIPGRPWTLNQMMRSHWKATARKTKDAKEVAFVLWREQLGPPLPLPVPLVVSVSVRTRDKRKQDTAAAAPLVKAAIDALVAGDYIRDDTPDIIAEHRYLAPEGGYDSDDTLITLHHRPHVG